MSPLPLSEAKRQRLRALSTPEGIIAALAMDQRKSLRRMLADTAGASLEQMPDCRLAEFKTSVATVLTSRTSAVLLDPEYGLQAAKARAPGCGLLLAYELDGYENPRPHRMLALMPHCSVRRLRDLGAQGIKILLHYAPRGLKSANDQKRALIERIGAECHALEMPFFLEPVVYDPHGLDQHSFEFACRKPELVVQTIEEFSKDSYNIDILKVEFPVIASFVNGSAVCRDRSAYSMETALEWFRAADAAARRPYIYLSAGVSSSEFLESLRLALRAGARFSGVLCGRANWQGGVPAYARPGPTFDNEALLQWLRTSGARNIDAVNELLRSATPWRRWFQDAPA
jgi:tagatose 1,6-diphosphate aldolase